MLQCLLALPAVGASQVLQDVGTRSGLDAESALASEPIPDLPAGTVIISTDTTWAASQSPYTWSNTVFVDAPATLSVEPGVIARFRQGCGLIVQGRLLAEGTEAAPILFTRYPGDTNWERILFRAAADSRLAHCIIEYCNSVGDHKDYYPTNCGPPFLYAPRQYHEAVVVLAGHVDFDRCAFTNLPNASATAAGDALAIISDDPDYPGPASANVRGCLFIRIGQAIHTRYASVWVEDCDFKDKHGDNDDVDLYGESASPSVIRYNRFRAPAYDDRINPTRCSALIYGNVIEGCTDHGIVLRDVSSPVVFDNLIRGCSNGGISVQNGCDALIVNNTILNCTNAIRMFDHLDRIVPPYCLSPTSGTATLVNNIIWNCAPALNLSGSSFGALRARVSYCNIQGGLQNVRLGTKGVLEAGPGNQDSDPDFVDAAANFRLTTNSPCLDAGTPQTLRTADGTEISRLDPDGTPRPLDGDGTNGPAYDLGAYEFLLDAADSNGDGIPDGWSWDYGLSPLTPDVATADPDHDDRNNYEEYVADTDPTNNQSYFQVINLAAGPPATLGFWSSSNRIYSLFWSTNLIEGGWSPVPDQQDIPGRQAQMELQDTHSAAIRKFYSVGVRVPGPLP